LKGRFAIALDASVKPEFGRGLHPDGSATFRTSRIWVRTTEPPSRLEA
jgi:hypothetical protein